MSANTINESPNAARIARTEDSAVSQHIAINHERVMIKSETVKISKTNISTANTASLETLMNVLDIRTAIEKVDIARHPQRPHTIDYISHICGDNFVEIAGDRRFGEDKAIIAGFGLIDGYKCALIGQEKGRTLAEKKAVNFGCAMPEGYRKAQRMMEIAHDLRIPIITLIDTPGAYPGIASEERGQAHALAECIATLFKVNVPIMSIIHGEGGSGGAIALGAGNQVAMLENAIYSVISPEGCAEILWKDVSKKGTAAEAQKITAQHLKGYGLVDIIISEPANGAHDDMIYTCNNVKNVIKDFLIHCAANPDINYLQARIDRYYQDYGTVFKAV
jgi:acetyl-CoA carboxylase carboxyl transferase subunit alpha